MNDLQIEQLIEKYTDIMNDFKDMYKDWNAYTYWVWRAYENIISDLKSLHPTEDTTQEREFKIEWDYKKSMWIVD